MKKLDLKEATVCLTLPRLFKMQYTILITVLLALSGQQMLYAQAEDLQIKTANSVPETYSRVNVKLNSSQFEMLNELIGFDHLHFEKDGSFTSEFSQSDIAAMKKLDAKVKVIIPDIVKDLTKNNNKRLINNSLSDLAPAGFTYGSMGGYLTYAEIVAKLDQLRALYPNLISEKFSIGKSTENRDLWVVRISNNPDVDQEKPKVFFNSLTHAREPAGMMQLIYYMCTLLQNYNTDPEIKYLVDNREIYFLPCVNPDGYEYNRSTNPNGGGMWRKNRYKETTVTIKVSNCRDVVVGRKCDTVWNSAHTSYTLKKCSDIKKRVCDTARTYNTITYGVDLNRNYSYKWAYDNTGSSPTKTSDTYRGVSAFSEPETKAIRDFSYLKNFKMVMNQHTPGNQLVYPFNYANVVDPNQALYDKRNTLLTETNGLLIGHMKTTAGYFSNGESSDWQYGEVTAKPKAFSWTPELGESFWPAQSLIETLCIRMLRTDLNMTWIAGEYFRYSAPAGLTATSVNFSVPVTITNYGENTGSIESIKFISGDGRSTGNDSISMSGIGIGATSVKNLPLNLSAFSGSGTASGVLRITYSDGYTQDKAFSFNYNLSSGQKSSKSTPISSANVDFTIYPNPTNGIFNITNKENETIKSVSVYNNSGTLMNIKGSENEIDLSNLSNGIYNIRIETVNGLFIDKRVTKQ